KDYDYTCNNHITVLLSHVARNTMQTFPLFANLAGRPVLVIGGGTVAERKTHALLEAGARVHLAAPDLTPQLKSWIEQDKVVLRGVQFKAHWLDVVSLVLGATDYTAVDQTVSVVAQARKKL